MLIFLAKSTEEHDITHICTMKIEIQGRFNLMDFEPIMNLINW